MMIFIEFAGVAFVSWAFGMSMGRNFESTKKKEVVEEKDDRIPFLGMWVINDGKQEWTYRCSKCDLDTPAKSCTLKYCTCPESPHEHFHWTCPKCEFKGLMKPKGDEK